MQILLINYTLEFSESKIDTKELLNVVSKLTTKNQLLEVTTTQV